MRTAVSSGSRDGQRVWESSVIALLDGKVQNMIDLLKARDLKGRGFLNVRYLGTSGLEDLILYIHMCGNCCGKDTTLHIYHATFVPATIARSLPNIMYRYSMSDLIGYVKRGLHSTWELAQYLNHAWHCYFNRLFYRYLHLGQQMTLIRVSFGRNTACCMILDERKEYQLLPHSFYYHSLFLRH